MATPTEARLVSLEAFMASQAATILAQNASITELAARALEAQAAGDTAFLLTSTALVLLMTIPGLALFYGGMARAPHVLSTVMQSFVITCEVTILWYSLGYSLAFGEGNNPFIATADTP
ncbi:ammonium transporter AmtB-like domain-containing protein [Baffinella frigidus]|nr:ammonium transporter AmtB-like domain-containing protein [Cryptophyta sp. CCMP2293]